MPHRPENWRGGLYICLYNISSCWLLLLNGFKFVFLFRDIENEQNMRALPNAVLTIIIVAFVFLFYSNFVAFFFCHCSRTKYICTNPEKFQLLFVLTLQCI